jgi:hypothetical protein
MGGLKVKSDDGNELFGNQTKAISLVYTEATSDDVLTHVASELGLSPWTVAVLACLMYASAITLLFGAICWCRQRCCNYDDQDDNESQVYIISDDGLSDNDAEEELKDLVNGSDDEPPTYQQAVTWTEDEEWGVVVASSSQQRQPPYFSAVVASQKIC